MKQTAEIINFCGKYCIKILVNKPIAPYTSFKIGGNCNILKADGISSLHRILQFCQKREIPYKILGGGSNVLISDDGLDEVVILLSGSEFTETFVDGEAIFSGAGVKLSEVCKVALEHGLTGLEFAYGIPGTVGGALYMNAGAFGGDMSQVVSFCDCYTLRRRNFRLHTEEMQLSYRHSVFAENPDWIITKVVFALQKGDPAAIKARMDEISAARVDKQPLDLPSAGSTFKRPEGYFAAKLIEDCGLKGRSVGGAMVSTKHSGFVVNTGAATFADVTSLIEIVKEEVRAKTGVELECEVQIWNS